MACSDIPLNYRSQSFEGSGQVEPNRYLVPGVVTLYIAQPLTVVLLKYNVCVDLFLQSRT